MARLVKHGIKVNGVFLPALGYSANILVKSSNKSNMAGTRLGGYTCV